MYKLSVVICTHNPRIDYLERVLMGLKEQTLLKTEWEVLLIDNFSNEELNNIINLSWHPNGRIIRENKLGLTHARIRGIEESKGDIIVFVDDDNILDIEYLKISLDIAKQWSILGAWGGSCYGVYESSKPDWIGPFEGYLAVKVIDKIIWSNTPKCEASMPWGAGLCIRRMVACKYRDFVLTSADSVLPDRTGTSLLTCGDTQMVLCCIDFDLGFGKFPNLKLNHLIPSRRTSLSYIKKLIEDVHYSGNLLKHIRGENCNINNYFTLFSKIKFIYYQLKRNKYQRMYAEAGRNADKRILKYIKES